MESVTNVKSVSKVLFAYCIYIYIYIYIYISLHTKFAAATHLLEGQLLHARESWVKFLILEEGAQTDLSIKEAQHFDPRKT